jgi:RNA polymerase-binding transcription factor DksA
MTSKRPRVRRCGTLFIGLLAEERKCGKPAMYHFDIGKKGGYPVCVDCTEHIHPSRLKRILPIPYLSLETTP